MHEQRRGKLEATVGAWEWGSEELGNDVTDPSANPSSSADSLGDQGQTGLPGWLSGI